jgi:hypothetical protein
VSVLDPVAAAIKNGVEIHPPHDCDEHVDHSDGSDGRCPECEALARYVLVTLEQTR